MFANRKRRPLDEPRAASRLQRRTRRQPRLDSASNTARPQSAVPGIETEMQRACVCGGGCPACQSRDRQHLLRGTGEADIAPEDPIDDLLGETSDPKHFPNPPGQSLDITTVSGPTPSKCGGYDWLVGWHLAQPSERGGTVIQHVVADITRKSLRSERKGHWDFWEAFQADPGTTGETVENNTDGPVPNEMLRGGQTDRFSGLEFAPSIGRDRWYTSPGAWGTWGFETTIADAKFYEGLYLSESPEDFVARPDGGRWDSPVMSTLLTSLTDPGFTGGTNSVDHTIEVNWDCSMLKNDTAIVSHSP